MNLDPISFFCGMAVGLIFTYLYKIIELDIQMYIEERKNREARDG